MRLTSQQLRRTLVDSTGVLTAWILAVATDLWFISPLFCAAMGGA